MVFGKIEYLNLLPFHVFMKRYIKSTQQKQSMEYYKNVPSKINKRFKQRKVDAAFISSIHSKGCKNNNLAIIAKKEIRSVIVIKGTKFKPDKESQTSNVLAKVLGYENEVLIGDKALKYTLKNNNYIDLANEWYKKHKLPFVFATFCYHSKNRFYKKVYIRFKSFNKKIPQYILNKKAKNLQISKKDILKYLELIEYIQTHKSKKSLKLFLKKAKSKL